MKRVKISIIVPIYNAETYLDNCIKTIINQTYSDFELLLIDDGSTDESYQICKRYETDSRVRIYKQGNAGVSAARNKGIQLSTGDYIWFIDADDWIEPEALEKFVEAYERFNGRIDIFSFNYMKYQKGKKIPISNIQQGYYTNEEYLKFMLNPSNHFGLVWSNIYSSKIMKGHRVMFDENLTQSEDVDFSVRIGRYVDNIYVSESAFYNYRITSGSLSRKYKEGIADSYITSLEKIQENVADYHNSSMQNDFNAYIRVIVIFIILNDYYHPENNKSRQWKLSKLTELLRQPLIAEALKRMDSKSMSKDKIILLHFIKSRNVAGIKFISKVRYLKMNQIDDK